MKAWLHITRVTLVSALGGLCLFGLAWNAHAEQAVDADARSVLAAMTNYLGGIKSFSVEFSAADEIVTADGQKLQFLHSGSITAQRPAMFHAVRRGATGTVEMFLAGQGLTLFSKSANAYLRLDASTIDSAIEAIHRFGYDAPGADLLASRPLDLAAMDTTSGTHIGMTYVDGVEVHQLAFRGTEVDWQLWVSTGDKPLPLRYVVTTKGVAGAPEFTLQLRNWKTAPRIDVSQFTFTPPSGAKMLEPGSVTVSPTGDLTIKGK